MDASEVTSDEETVSVDELSGSDVVETSELEVCEFSIEACEVKVSVEVCEVSVEVSRVEVWSEVKVEKETDSDVSDETLCEALEAPVSVGSIDDEETEESVDWSVADDDRKEAVDIRLSLDVIWSEVRVDRVSELSLVAIRLGEVIVTSVRVLD